jgi:glycerol-1-phosphate dehydrogenase [NAD(P)+]
MTRPNATLTLTEALAAADDTKALEIGHGVLGRVAPLYRELIGMRPAILVADQRTFAAAGEAVNGFLQAARLPLVPPFIFQEEDLHAEFGFVESLESHLRTSNAIPVAVGSGTINDLTKLASSRAGRPYLCVGTAASMDGYTAYGASITFRGSKQTFECPAPLAVVADLDVICAAPEGMNASGYADLLAKVPAGADWLLADALGTDKMHDKAWAIIQGRLRELVADPSSIAARKPEAIRRLLEGLMLGGFAMQVAKSSRVASGAEHQFSHLWDMQHHTHEGRTPSHGFKVGLGTLATTALYECLLDHPLEELDLDGCCAAWPDWDSVAETIGTLFPQPELAKIALTETRAKYSSRVELRAQLARLREDWPQLRPKLTRQLLPFSKLRQMLADAGAPVAPEQIGISRSRLRQTYREAYFIRRRLTVLDLAVRTGLLDACLDRIFSGAFR